MAVDTLAGMCSCLVCRLKSPAPIRVAVWMASEEWLLLVTLLYPVNVSAAALMLDNFINNSMTHTLSVKTNFLFRHCERY